jgi:anti-sigma regulatory factor (Ser/Thr protein kinase)
VKLDCRFAPEPESISVARRRVTAALADLPADAADRLSLIVSELATNCVVHAGTDFRVTVQYADGAVRGEVSDSGPGRARLRRPNHHEAHGRGLQIVDQLAAAWGVREAAGTTVWFRLDVGSDAG